MQTHRHNVPSSLPNLCGVCPFYITISLPQIVGTIHPPPLLPPLTPVAKLPRVRCVREQHTAVSFKPSVFLDLVLRQVYLLRRTFGINTWKTTFLCLQRNSPLDFWPKLRVATVFQWYNISLRPPTGSIAPQLCATLGIGLFVITAFTLATSAGL